MAAMLGLFRRQAAGLAATGRRTLFASQQTYSGGFQSALVNLWGDPTCTMAGLERVLLGMGTPLNNHDAAFIFNGVMGSNDHPPPS
jgi:hypothetical protein